MYLSWISDLTTPKYILYYGPHKICFHVVRISQCLPRYFLWIFQWANRCKTSCKCRHAHFWNHTTHEMFVLNEQPHDSGFSQTVLHPGLTGLGCNLPRGTPSLSDDCGGRLMLALVLCRYVCVCATTPPTVMDVTERWFHLVCLQMDVDVHMDYET